MTEYERKREEIGGIILKAMYYGLLRSEHWWAKQEHDELPLFADQILSLVEIRADVQGLPDPNIIYDVNANRAINAANPTWMNQHSRESIYIIAQQDMLKAGFVKVAPKPC